MLFRSQCLYGIGVEGNAGAFGDSADLFEGLNRSDFVVGVLAREKNGLRADCGSDVSWTQKPIGLWTNPGNSAAMFFEKAATVFDGGMLDGGGNDVRLPPVVARKAHFDNPVVRLTAAGGEKDLFRLCMQECGNAFSGIGDRLAGCLTGVIPGRRVSGVL